MYVWVYSRNVWVWYIYICSILISFGIAIPLLHMTRRHRNSGRKSLNCKCIHVQKLPCPPASSKHHFFRGEKSTISLSFRHFILDLREWKSSHFSNSPIQPYEFHPIYHLLEILKTVFISVCYLGDDFPSLLAILMTVFILFIFCYSMEWLRSGVRCSAFIYWLRVNEIGFRIMLLWILFLTGGNICLVAYHHAFQLFIVIEKIPVARWLLLFFWWKCHPFFLFYIFSDRKKILNNDKYEKWTLKVFLKFTSVKSFSIFMNSNQMCMVKKWTNLLIYWC